jgi:hypothetical protein
MLLATALASRWRVLGDPIIHMDEQFYLLVAGRMLHGATLYVDIWDRKPIGLFLIYMLPRLAGGSGVLGYQILALVCVVSTALILFALARRVASDAAAMIAAMLYILWLGLAGGEGGQAPVFYNLPVAGAIAILFFASKREAARGGNLRGPGIAVMLIFGIALQIKYSAVFEGIFAGLTLLGTALGRGRRPVPLLIDLILWVGCALLPTILVGLSYAAIGHGNDWLYANFLSIMARGQEPHRTVMIRFAIIVALVAPLVAAIPLRRILDSRPIDKQARDDLRFFDSWAAAALLGVVLFGTWFNHYGLPLAAPLAVTAAPLGRVRLGRLYLALLLAYSVIAGQILISYHLRDRGDAQMLQSAAAAVQGHRNCIFVYDGMTALYDAGQSCVPTTHPFPEHLQSVHEQGATGIDEVGEVHAIMARRPDRVLTMEPGTPEENPASRKALYDILGREYVEIWRRAGAGRDFVIYGRIGTLPPGMRGSVHSAARPLRTECHPSGDRSLARLLSDPKGWVDIHLLPLMGSCL